MKIVTTLAAICAAIVGNASAALTTVDFNDGVAGTNVGSFYAAQGIIISSDGASDPTRAPEWRATPGGLGIADVSRTVPGFNEPFNIRVDFTVPVDMVMVDVGSATGLTITMELFDALGNSLTSTTSGALTFGVLESVMASAFGTAYAVFTSSSPFAGIVVVDNLTFGTNPVPVPAALPLMIAGAGAVAAMRRKRSVVG